MVSSHVDDVVYDIKASSVTTSRVRGEAELRELSHTDLAVKLHYIRALYFFKGDAVKGIDIYALKKPMFEWLDLYYPASGRIRRSGKGQPFIKCNDGGVRIIEAKCGRSVDEWLGLNDRRLDDQLVRSQVLGPELEFSPLVFVQFTWFTCGGLSVGLSWAHILGDSFSASSFINMWGHILSNHQMPRNHLKISHTEKSPKHSFSTQPLSLKTIDSVGDTWRVPETKQMETHSFHVTEKVIQEAGQQKIFPFLTALLWKSISRIRELEIKAITICSKGSWQRGNEIPYNSQVIGTVEADFNIEKVDLFDLAKWVDEKMIDERGAIEDHEGITSGKFDFVLYGANLTFVNLEEADLYGLELQGNKPVFANLVVDGVEGKGAIFVLPRTTESDGDGRTMTVILPKNDIVVLKNVLSKEWGIY